MKSNYSSSLNSKRIGLVLFLGTENFVVPGSPFFFFFLKSFKHNHVSLKEKFLITIFVF
jgi:hypothetical protein